MKLIGFIFFISISILQFAQTGGNMGGSFSISSAGGTNYEIPIDVPPGLQKMTPQISIVYNNQSGNGILGEGFSLSGLSAIRRTAATPAQDGFKGGVNYDENDRFSLDGKRLFNINEVEGGYSGDGAIYNTQVQSWAKITANGSCGCGPCSFTVILKNGTILEYGFTEDAQVKAVGLPFEQGAKENSVRKWLLNKVSDLNGNYITYTYSSTPPNLDSTLSSNKTSKGESYITSIAYTGNVANDLSPQRFIKFYYENRSDSLTHYVGGGQVQTTARLTQIQTQIILPNYISEIIHTYDFQYDSLNPSGKSRILSVTMLDKDGNYFPPHTFDWTDGVDGFKTKTSSFTGNLDNNGWVGDYNGDGLTDLLSYSYSENNDQISIDSLYFSRGESFESGQAVNNVYLNTLSPYIADFNADGLADIIGLGLDTAIVWLCNGNGFDDAYGIGSVPFNSEDDNLWISDFNGDGRSDIFLEYGYEFLLYLSNGKTLNSPITTTPSINTESLLLGDFNGDGLTDIYTSYSSGADSIYFSNFSLGSDFSPAIANTNINFTDQSWVSDFNQDGIDDIMVDYGNEGNLSLSNGYGFQSALNIKELELGSHGNWLGDYNGDGFTDLFVNGSGSDSSVLYLSESGKGFVPVSKLPSMNLSESNVWVGDFNGDGSTDLFSSQSSAFMLLSSNNQQVEGVDGQIASSNHLTDFVIGIENGLGARIDINYFPITDSTVYRETAESFNDSLIKVPVLNRYQSSPVASTYTSLYPVQPFQSATYVVRSYQLKNGKEDSATYTYNYEGAKLDMNGYGWLGYRKIEKTDTTKGQITVQNFHQLFPFTGLTESTELYTLDDKLMMRNLSNYSVKDSIYTNTAKIYTVKQSYSKNEHYDYGAFAYATDKKYSYDIYGNLVKLEQRDLSDSTKILYLLNEYSNDTTKWQLGYLSQATFSSDSLGQDKFSSLQYHYDTITKDTILSKNWVSGDAWTQTAYLHDNYGNLTHTISNDKDTSQIVYDSFYHTFPSKSISPPNANGERLELKLTVDPRFGSWDTLINPNGYSFISELDDFGRRIALYGPDLSGNTTLLTTTNYTINPAGGIIQSNANLVEWGRGLTDSTATYTDALGRTVLTTSLGFDGGKILSTSRYSMSNQLIQRSYPYSIDSTAIFMHYEYDPYGRISEVRRPISATDTVVYKTAYSGQKIQVYNPKKENSTGTQLYFQTLNGERCFTSLIDQNLDTVKFTYDLIGQLLKTYNTEFTINSQTYDGLGRTTSSDNISLGKTNYQYNDEQLTVLETTENGDSLFTKSDALGRPIYQEFSNGDSLIFEYDLNGFSNAKGHLARVIMSPTHSYEYTYDPFGNLDTTKLYFNGKTYQNSISYQPNKNPINYVLPDGSVQNYIYTSTGFVESINLLKNEDTTNILTYQSYLDNGIANKLLYGNGVKLIEQSLFTGAAEEITLTNPENEQLLNLMYSWNDSYEIDTISRNGSITEEIAYQYDPTGRLLRAAASNDTEAFAYNGLGNMIQNDSLTIDYTNFQPTVVQNQLQDTVETLTYDTRGNLTDKYIYSDGEVFHYQFDYNLWNQQVSVQLNGDTLNEYAYDYQGNLLLEKRWADSTEILYPCPGYSIVSSENQGKKQESVKIKISANDRLIAEVCTTNENENSITYYHQDNVNSTVLTTDETGNKIEEIAYKAFGAVKQRISAKNGTVTYLFGSKEYSETTELYNFSARYYDPHIGSFSTSDNQLGGDAWKVDAYNNYAYALNNPIKYADPSGHGAGEDVAITATVAVVAGVEVVSAVLTGGGDIPELVAGDLALTATLESSEELTVESTLELTSDLEDVSSVDSFLDSDDEESDMEVDDPEDEDFVPNSKKQSNRSKYMGATPQKNSPVGREVIERMRGENKVRYYGKNTEFLGSDGIWRNIKDADMSHKHNKTAVIRWNEKYYVFGERSPQVRRFMNKSKHYYLEYKRINRREGGQLKARYRKPVKRGKGRTILVRKLVE